MLWNNASALPSYYGAYSVITGWSRRRFIGCDLRVRVGGGVGVEGEGSTVLSF